MIQSFTSTQVFEIECPASLVEQRIKTVPPEVPVLVYADETSLNLPRRYTRLLAITGMIFGCAMIAFRFAILTDELTGFLTDPLHLLIASVLGAKSQNVYLVVNVALPVILVIGSVF